MVRIEPYIFQKTTAFKERVDIANKLNEVIDYINRGGGGGGDIPVDIQEQIDEIKSRLDDDETDIEDLNSDITSLENNIQNITTSITNINTELEDVIETIYDYNSIKADVTILKNDMQTYRDAGTNERRPVLKLGITYGIGNPYVRTPKDVAFLDDIPIYTKVEEKPASNAAFLSEYFYKDENDFYHANKNLMIICYMTNGQYKTVTYKIAKDESVSNFGTYLFQEAGFSQSNVYTITQWLLNGGPYDSVMYKTQLNFSSSGVTRTSDLTVPFTWDLYVG